MSGDRPVRTTRLFPSPFSVKKRYSLDILDISSLFHQAMQELGE